MSTISNAVPSDSVSRVLGYELGAGADVVNTPFLPQRVIVFGEVNTANVADVTFDTKYEITSAQEAGESFGFGSPVHQLMRILRPVNGGGLRGIPTIVIPQETDGAATAAESEITVTGTATKAGTHRLLINGRDNVDGQFYNIAIAKDDTPTLIAAKIASIVSEVIGAPVSGASAVGVATLTTKWKGVTAAELNVSIDTLNTDVGVSYAVGATSGGAGVVDLSGALAIMSQEWNTIIINPYGASQFTALEDYIGVPGVGTSTGLYDPLVFKPAIALWGSVLSDKDDIKTITNAAARKTQVANVLCPAPNSDGWSWEATANVCRIIAPLYQDTPNASEGGRAYPDMPVPDIANGETIGDMAFYTNRDFIVKGGGSTVSLVSGAYQIEDLVTTYHPDGEVNPAFKRARSLNIHWNVKYRYRVFEVTYVQGKTLVNDIDVVTASDVISPKQWKQVLFSNIFDYFVDSALLADASFSKENTQVAISSTNPDRFDVSMKYKITGTAEIVSTTAETFFNFGN